MKNKILKSALALIMLVCYSSVHAQALSGNFGTNNSLRWELSEFGQGLKLEISGQGAMTRIPEGKLWLYYRVGFLFLLYSF